MFGTRFMQNAKNLLCRSFCTTQNLSQAADQVIKQADKPIKLKKNPLRFFLGLVGLNVALAFGYAKKVEYDNRYSFKILMKLLEFKKAYEQDPSKFTLQEIKELFDEFLVENVALTLDEKHTEAVRKITKDLCEKYPKEREIQLFASEVSEYEKRGIYLKAALIIDRKYIDDVLIRQMTINCERFGKDKPYFFDEFYDACTKYSLDSKYKESEECLQKYMELNPPNYYRAAIQQIKNYKDHQSPNKLMIQIEKLFEKEKDLDQKEKDHILSYLTETEITNQEDKLKAASMLLQSNPQHTEKLAKSVLVKEKGNLQALILQAEALSRQSKDDQLNQVLASIKKINPSFELKKA